MDECNKCNNNVEKKARIYSRRHAFMMFTVMRVHMNMYIHFYFYHYHYYLYIYINGDIYIYEMRVNASS